jgi:hypothetical protein
MTNLPGFLQEVDLGPEFGPPSKNDRGSWTEVDGFLFDKAEISGILA